ncbi:DNA repair helicase-like protein [Emericellopsis cladophorae]|uniref:DNA 3'-5' helicase n=1 Tax=Emericellopsis cladophorae TaxID=2686198 RepID=A0A9P9Y2Y7_9HYPO|nr:DNA repair helicase-like protein [Emericellopsis cladophorae]KAI6782130.1 DNA repair helicase-like protein [Emericellopsis cladophorae]
MPPKRKAAPSAAKGEAKAGRTSRMSTPGAATPRSLDDTGDDAEDEPVVGDEELQRELDKNIDIFSVDKYKKKHTVREPMPHIFGNNDYSYLDLKKDHQNRPLWIDPQKGRIILESFNPLAEQAQDFLVTIAEPLSRPTFMHEYALTTHSLYAAVSVGLSPSDIISTLDRFLKTPLPEEIRNFITNCTQSYGKVKLVLKNTKYFVESPDPDVLQLLLKDPIIGPLRVQHGDQELTTEAAPKIGALVIPGTGAAKGVTQTSDQQLGDHGEAPKEKDVFATLNEDDDDEQDVTHAFEIADKDVETVQKQCLLLNYPVLEEYDFRRDEVNANLEIDLRPGTQIRPYQEKSLSKMFGNGRAKSGLIVLPCGAGKTLVGITAACTIKKGVIVLCTSSMSVVQWRLEFLKWSNINPEDIVAFTSDNKGSMFTGSTGIVVTTYSMLTQAGQRSYDADKMMKFLTNREWGLMLLDEVHVVPANIFRRVTSSIKSHSKLGLTATLLREDDKISDLNFLIGPKLFEANWMELSKQGHIARVQCAEVWCPMPTEFYDEYLKAPARKKQLLYIMNPRKFQACQYLINYHEARGDKIIVFADNVYALKKYAFKLGRAFIYGGTPQAERLKVLDNFQKNPELNTLFLSKIGDTSLDLPEATCLIQISSHYGSRRQEAQRLGRILRAKRRNDEGFNAFFYSLVSKDTQEVYFSSKRQAFLVDQGYAFKVITQLANMENTPDLAFSTPAERRELLQTVLVDNETAEDDEIDDDLFHRGKKGKKKGTRRTAGTLGELSGGQDMAYIERNKKVNQALKKGKGKQESHSFFKKIGRENARRAVQ